MLYVLASRLRVCSPIRATMSDRLGSQRVTSGAPCGIDECKENVILVERIFDRIQIPHREQAAVTRGILGRPRNLYHS